MGLPNLALPWLLETTISAPWTLGESGVPDIGNEKMPSMDALKVGKWVKDTNRSLLAPSLDSVSSMAVIDTLSSDLSSPLSSPSTSPASSFGSSVTGSSSFASMLNKGGNKSTFAAPMLSPASSTDSLDFFGPAGVTFLDRVFPTSDMGRSALNVDSKLTGWSLALVEGHDGSRTVYAKGSNSVDVRSRENVIALLDHADEELACDQVVVVLEKKDSDLAETLHSLLYIGGSVIPASAGHSEANVLVGLEL